MTPAHLPWRTLAVLALLAAAATVPMVASDFQLFRLTNIVIYAIALLGMKKHLNRIARGTLDVADLARDTARAGASADLQEGRAAWAARRSPTFTGR